MKKALLSQTRIVTSPKKMLSSPKMTISEKLSFELFQTLARPPLILCSCSCWIVYPSFLLCCSLKEYPDVVPNVLNPECTEQVWVLRHFSCSFFNFGASVQCHVAWMRRHHHRCVVRHNPPLSLNVTTDLTISLSQSSNQRRLAIQSNCQSPESHSEEVATFQALQLLTNDTLTDVTATCQDLRTSTTTLCELSLQFWCHPVTTRCHSIKNGQ